MHVIHAQNVNDALGYGLAELSRNGIEEPSRNGPVLALPSPITFVYANPKERVMFSAERNANPFFHLFEALWMLGGRNDVAFPAHYAVNLQLFSDDSKTLNGAYGHRWRNHFGYDQLRVIIDELKANPASRRCVLAMWDGMNEQYTTGSAGAYEGDLMRAVAGGKDVPCNTHVYFRIVSGRLYMTVLNRSNDAVWGAQGANAVQFSCLQEYVAAFVGVPVGLYYQVANNYHVYTAREDVQRLMGVPGYISDNRYGAGRKDWVSTTPLVNDRASWHEELEDFLDNAVAGRGGRQGRPYLNMIFNVANMMAIAHQNFKADNLQSSIEYLEGFRLDWLVAGQEWLKRVADKRSAKEAK